MTDQKPFEQWAIVEVMGHNTYAGLVSEQTLAGTGFVRVDVPELPALKERYCNEPPQPGFTKLIGTASIYAITPCSEEIARQAAARVRTRPIHMLEIPATARPQLQSADAEEGDY